MARATLAWVPRLSRHQLLRLARLIAESAYVFDRGSRNVGLTNLQIAFPDQPPAEHQRVLRAAYRNFALAILDTFWFSRRTSERLREHTSFDPVAFAPLLRPAPQICITAHYGNWEVMGMAFSALGHPLISVAAPIENPQIDSLFNQLRTITGQEVVSKHGALRRLLRTLHEGGKIALLLDQNTKQEDGGRFVPFFGLPVLVSGAAAALWRRTGAEVIVVMSRPGENGRYLTPTLQQIAPPDTSDPAEAELEMTRRITAAIEHTIRREPEHWLWMYKRWKYVAPGVERERYPHYAKAVRAP